MRRLPTLVRAATKHLFTRYLLLTNTTVTVLLSVAGDCSQQGYERQRGRLTHWDQRRSLHVGSTGFVIGPAAHFWYAFLERLLPGRTVTIVVKKILLDQIFFTPFYIGTFFGVLASLEGSTMARFIHDLKHRGWSLMFADLAVWPPAQAVNFMLLPARFRVLYDNIIGLGFDCYSSYVKYRTE